MEKRVKILSALCLVIALVSFASSAYMGYMLNAKLNVLEKSSLVVYNGVVALKTDGSNQLEVNAEDFHLWMSAVWYNPDDKVVQLRIEMRQGNVFSSQTCCGAGDLYYLSLDDVKVVAFRGYTVQVWFTGIGSSEIPAATFKVIVVNISSAQPPIGQDTGIVFSGDITFGKGVREDFSITAADFNFSVHVDLIDYKEGKVALSYSASQGGVDKHGQIMNAGSNDVIIEDFRGYTMKLWIREIIPPSSTNPEPSVIINIRIVH